MARTTVCCSAGVSSGKIGRASVSRAARFAFGQAAGAVAEALEALLQVERNRVVDLRADFLFREMRTQGVAAAVGHAHDVLIPHVSAARRDQRQREDAIEPGHGEQLAVTARVRLATSGPIVEMAELDVEHGGLQRVEPAVDADDLVMIARLHAVSAQ